MIKRLVLIMTSLLLPCTGMAGQTATLVKTRRAASASVVPGTWHASLSKCKTYARDHGVPLIAVWSNGDKCGHCLNFESACNNSTFKNWMKTSGCVFFFTHSGESGGGQGGTAYKFCEGGKGLMQFPFVRVYWYVGGSKKKDVAVTGDTVDGGFGGGTGASKAVKWFKKQISGFAAAPAVVKPYTIQFAGNGATNEMASVTAKVGTARALPANTFIRPDYSFTGWAKTASGAVAYKNKASVKNLTTVSNGVVTLYAKWKRTTFRTYYTGIKYTISMTDLKGWTPNKKVTGMTWNKTKGKWTGKPTKAGTFTIKFKKNSSSTTRKVVVVKDAVTFADELASSRVFAEGEDIALDISPASLAGAAKSVTVTGLPAGLGYADGVVTGQTERVGTFKATVTVVSAKGQKLTRAVSIQVGVPEFCIGTFNGFIGFVDTNRIDELALANRGTFRLAAPSNANLSAKVVTAKGTYAFTGLGWLNRGNGVYAADLATADGKHVLEILADDESMGLKASFHEIGTFTPSYGTTYSVWAQRAPFARNADGSYCDPMIDDVMKNRRVVGTWYFKAYAAGGAWQLDYATKSTANLTLVVAEDGIAQLAGKVGSYAVSGSSSVFVFDGDVEMGFVRADFPVPVTVNKVKKTLDIWINLWFDRDHGHFNARGEGIGAASLETFE